MGWDKKYTTISIAFGFLVLVLIQVIFPGKVFGLEWILAAFVIYFFAFYYVQAFQSRWGYLSDKKFIYRLFWVSFLIRIAVMVILLIISYRTWNMVYYVGAMDEPKYYRVASEAATIFKESGYSVAYSHILDTYREDISDTGFCTFQAFLMVVFGYSPILFKIIYCFIGSITVVKLYQISLLLFERPVARLAAIFYMLFPIAWFFSAVMMKEAIMVFLIVESIYQIVKLRQSFKTITLIKLLLLIIVLFFFRSSTSILMIPVIGISMLLGSKKKRLVVNVIVTILLIGGYIYFLESTGRAEKYYLQYTDTDEFVEQRILAGSQVNPFITVASAPVYIGISLFAPFPSIVKVPISFAREIPHDEYYYHVAGCMFWVVIAFFSVIGMYHAIRFQREKLAPLWIFILGYLFILFRAILITSVRFTYPVKPFLLIMAAYGVYKLKNKKLFFIYLFFAFIMIMGWNYVRLKGRGG